MAAAAGATLQLDGLSPYWMDRATCTLNPVQLKGLYLLTAPNMSGKSTLMRSVLVAALLANCGLCVPCTSAVVPRYACMHCVAVLRSDQCLCRSAI